MSKTKYYFDSDNLEFVPIKRTFIERSYRLSLFLISSVIIGAFITVLLMNTDFIDTPKEIVQAREIDNYGIRVATELSMIRALKKLKKKPSEIIIDGPLLLRPWEGTQKNIISGDSKYIAIGAASIVAKVSRDNLMERLEKKYVGYLLFKNKGYGTREHLSIIKEDGITNLHRRSFLKDQILFSSHQSKKSLTKCC